MLANSDMQEALEPGLLERRSHERVPLRLKVGFQILTDEEAMNETAEFDTKGLPLGESASLDLSMGGMKLLCDMSLMGSRRLEKGAFLKVEIEVPGKLSGIPAIATVAWSRKTSTPNTFEAGVSFVGLDPEDSQRLKEFLTSRGAA